MAKLTLRKALKPSNCMLCYKKSAVIDDHPRVTRGVGNRESKVLFLTHQPLYGCCKPEFNTPLSAREVTLLNNSLSAYGITVADFYTINVVLCSSEKLTLPTFRKCFEAHTSKIIIDEQYTHIIGLGEQVARYVFSRGKAPPPMDVLCGKVVQQFDFPEKKLFFVHHPNTVLLADKTDMEKFSEINEKFTKSVRALGAFLKKEGLT